MECSISYKKYNNTTDYLCCCLNKFNPHDEKMKFKIKFPNNKSEFGEKNLF